MNLSAIKFRRATREDVATIVRMFASDVLGAKRERYTEPVAESYLKAYEAITADDRNELIVAESDGKIMSYNPERTATEAEVYEPTYRQLAVGERVMFTKTWKYDGTPIVKAANRQLGTIEALDDGGNVTVKLDTPPDQPEKRLSWKLEEMPHLDYGYVITSYSSQGTTTDRVIIHMDTDAPNVQQMLSVQLAYVAASRGRLDAHLVVNDDEELTHYLSRRPENPTALDRPEIHSYQVVRS